MTEAALLKQRLRRKANGNATTHKYEKTKNGFLMRTYRNMKSRTLGIQKKKAHLYKGLPLLSKETFYEWSLNYSAFSVLFCAWENSCYDRKLTPSINRIDASLGYVEGNIEWITHSQNSKQTRRWQS